ncbi:MAG: hypothetical protein ACQSGP_31800, partial [Frankia sp.]
VGLRIRRGRPALELAVHRKGRAAPAGGCGAVVGVAQPAAGAAVADPPAATAPVWRSLWPSADPTI